jgi:hypothetical protein
MQPEMRDPLIGEIELAKIPQDRLFAVRRQVVDASHDFFISIIFDDVLRGSGTLVDAWGTLGILTAYHVAHKTLDRDPFGSVCLTIAGFPHRFEIPRECIDHIPLGIPRPEAGADGPDLSFLKLSGEPVISRLKSRKSFYRLSGKTCDGFQAMGPEKLFWWILGAPASISRPMTSTLDEGALMATHLMAQAGYAGVTGLGNLDVLRLALNAGDEPYPEDYRGASGGPVWVSALTMDEPGADLSTVEFMSCHLAGVVFYQGDLNTADRSREIFANGPRTLDSLLGQFKTATSRYALKQIKAPNNGSGSERSSI